MKRKIIVYYYDGRVDEYEADDWPGPQPNFLRGFVEVANGVFLNSNDIKRIEVVRDE